MPHVFDLFYLFEHPAFVDVHDAQRQSRLYGFRYRVDHAKYETLCTYLRQCVSNETLAEYLSGPLEKVPDNSALYIIRIKPEGRQAILPPLLEGALALGFSIHDDHQGQCHCPAGLWTVDGLQPREA